MKNIPKKIITIIMHLFVFKSNVLPRKKCKITKVVQKDVFA